MIGFIGGTGNQGRALALRLAASGKKVLLGSRLIDKAENVAQKIKAEREGLNIKPVTNEEAAREGEIVFVTLPYSSMKGTLGALRGFLKGKIVVDVINPLTNNNVHKGISASEEIQAVLKDSEVVCAFKNVSHYLIDNLSEEVDVDSIVCSDHVNAKNRIMDLSKQIGIPCVDGDGLENALASELLTRLLLQLNMKYEAETGIRIVSHKF
jgi:NADPH-dependent F420 reductase